MFKGYLTRLYGKISSFWVNTFIKKPSNLWALKISVSIASVLLPTMWLIGDMFMGMTMTLGIVATALAETDIHPKSRLKSLIAVLSVILTMSTIVELTLDKPFIFISFIALACFSLTIFGGINARTQGVAFGGLLIITYTMLGHNQSTPFYYQPLLFTLGGILYSIVSVFLLFNKPWRILQEQMAYGYEKLAEYTLCKSKLFPSTEEDQADLKSELALLNIEVFKQIEQIKHDLYAYTNECTGKEHAVLNMYFQKWHVLQKLHERSTSSHIPYDSLSEIVDNKEVVLGLGQMMREISNALKLYAESLLAESEYEYPLSLGWTTNALGELIAKSNKQYKPLSLLYRNLSKMSGILKDIDSMPLKDEEKVENQRVYLDSTPLRNILTANSPRFRYAIRLTVCFVVGFSIMYFFKFEKGAWILLTSLLVCQQTYNATRQRIFHRILGTTVGVLTGYAVSNIIPTDIGQILILLVSAYLFFYWVKSNYTLAVIFITVFVLEAFNLQAGNGVMVLLPRLIDTLIGASLVFLVVRFLWPNWQYKNLEENLMLAIRNNKRYFESVYRDDISEADYMHNQRSVHRADTALTNTWYGMKLEPKSKQKMIASARNLVYLNHSLVSFIAALGAHKKKNAFSSEETEYCNRLRDSFDYISELWNRTDSKESQVKFDALVGELRSLRDSFPESNYFFIYNIAKVAEHLFLETRELVH